MLKVSKTDVTKRGHCRIIAGKWRGRIIRFEDAEGLRPTTDRIRETVFNWLQPYLSKSACLDGFAGSGVLGFEALSRGAVSVVFVENNRSTVKNLYVSAAQLRDGSVAIVQADFLSWLAVQDAATTSDKTYDLVFLDPPFHTGLMQKSVMSLATSRCLAADAIIYIEQAVDEVVVLPDNWLCLKEKKSGQVIYKLYQRQDP